MESPTIITIYSNDNVEVVWCSRSGKVRVKPDGFWMYPEFAHDLLTEEDEEDDDN